MNGDGDLRLAIRESSPIPVYEQIRAQVEGLIRTGALATGDRLPSVRQLAGDLRIAPGTVAKAYAQLSEQGLIVTGMGRAARVSAASTLPESLMRAAEAYATDARAAGVRLEDAINALRARW